MIFILGKTQLLLKSKFYNSKINWNYPLEELDYLIKENTDPNMIYVVGDDNRIYETSCKREDLGEIYKDLKQEIKLREFEFAALSRCIKLYFKAGKDVAIRDLEEWQKRMMEYNPNKDEIINNFKAIITPFENSKLKTFKVQITEEAKKIVPIMAQSAEEAVNKVIQKYNDREIVFDPDEYEDLNLQVLNLQDSEENKIDIPEINLCGNIYFSFDGIDNFETLKNTPIEELEDEGKIVTVYMDDIPLNVALIAGENKLYLVSYLYDGKNYRTDDLTSNILDIDKFKKQEELKVYMESYFINTFVDYMDYIDSFREQEEMEE